MKLIITRPEEDCGVLAQVLRGRGHDVIIAPLIKITPRAHVEVPDLPYQAVCLTSANAARHLPASVSRRASAFTPGAQSAVAAMAAGFGHVEAKGGNVEGMAAHIKLCLKPERGPILYVSGSETSGDLAGTLKADGFNVVKVVAYDAVAQALPMNAALLASCDGALLYSQRTAKIWVAEMERLGLFPRLSHFCLSKQVADALPEKWRIRVAQEPTESAILGLIDLAAK